MAKAPKPGTTRPEDKKVLPAATFTYRGHKHAVDMATLTLGERRRAMTELKKVDGADEAEALAAMLWIYLRRDDPSIDFLELLDEITFGDIASMEDATVQPRVDDPEA